MSKENLEDYVIPPNIIIEDDDDLDDDAGWGLHFCPWDPDCRQFTSARRLYIHTPWGSLIIAFTGGSMTQLWLPWKTRNPGASDGKSNYSRWWSPIVWHPR